MARDSTDFRLELEPEFSVLSLVEREQRYRFVDKPQTKLTLTVLLLERTVFGPMPRSFNQICASFAQCVQSHPCSANRTALSTLTAKSNGATANGRTQTTVARRIETFYYFVKSDRNRESFSCFSELPRVLIGPKGSPRNLRVLQAARSKNRRNRQPILIVNTEKKNVRI